MNSIVSSSSFLLLLSVAFAAPNPAPWVTLGSGSSPLTCDVRSSCGSGPLPYRSSPTVAYNPAGIAEPGGCGDSNIWYNVGSGHWVPSACFESCTGVLTEFELRKRTKRLVQISKTKKPTTLTALSLVQATTEEADSKSSLTSILPPVELRAIELPAGRSLSTLAKDSKYLEWLFNIKAENNSLGGRYLVHVFLWSVPHNANPSIHDFALPCGNLCSSSFSEDDVVEYPKVNLHWEVTDASGTRCEKGRIVVGGLLLDVSSNESTIAKAQYDLPHCSSRIMLYAEITTKQDKVTGRAEKTGITAADILALAPPAL
ncbi:hypothetical protein G7054_g7836 [Neopestalotiopsis clavispora]|nr:hypothetical protein G7054_g7836 [Neopestalotiopsis clavispora]